MVERKHAASSQTSRNASKNKSRYRAQRVKDPSQSQSKPSNRHIAPVSASGIHNDDVGIFVTCDKGQEKKCLQDLGDLLGQYIPDEEQPEQQLENGQSNEADKGNDIEADILAELNDLRPKSVTKPNSQKLSLITLDIPCVSFVRFPTAETAQSNLDPVDIVRKMCLSASQKEFVGPRSRYIKRLTPVSLVRKTMNNGLESLCEKILPPHFLIQPDSGAVQLEAASKESNSTQPVKFAIRPTIRNNNKLDRDQVIRTVADKVTELGQGKHTVDLKGYEKLILVDIYRNVVGMSVVGSEFETLKRFNLAELHASHFNDDTQDQREAKAEAVA